MKRNRARENSVRWITLLFVILLLKLLSAAHRDLTFEQIFLGHGLSQSIVQCICPDRTGFMWFGTEDGLNQFDGYEFTGLRNDPADTNRLSYNNVTALCEDFFGNLWIGTFYGGLNCYNPRTRRIRRFQNDPANPGSQMVAVTLKFMRCSWDHQGIRWIGTRGRTVSWISPSMRNRPS